jgi:hypothetical protein
MRQVCRESREDLRRMRETLHTWIAQAKKHQEDNKTTRHNIDKLNMEIQNTDDPEEIKKLEKRRNKLQSKLWYTNLEDASYEQWMTVPEPHGDRLIGLKDYFHNLQYSYAITAHKSQGSTYDFAFIYSEDLSNNGNKKECLQLFYVAVTRPSLGIYFTEDRSPTMLTEEESESYEQEAKDDNP